MHSISVVVPVYQGEKTITALVEELDGLCAPSSTPGGAQFTVDEIVLVHDNGPDRSDVVLLELERRFDQVCVSCGSVATTARTRRLSPVWPLHVASGIVTMDEDGQHDPVHIGAFLDTALTERFRSRVFQTHEHPPAWILAEPDLARCKDRLGDGIRVP